jgi:hypothetical protein
MCLSIVFAKKEKEVQWYDLCMYEQYHEYHVLYRIVYSPKHANI